MPVNKNELTKEQIIQAMKCKNADELMALAKDGGYELTKDEAEAYLTELALTDVLVKPLENGEVAVCFFNKSPAAMDIRVRMSDITNLSWVDIPSAAEYECFDLWSKEKIKFRNELSATVDPHGAEVFRIKAL